MMQHLVSSLSVSGRPVHRLRENEVLSQPAHEVLRRLQMLRTEQPLTENDDTRCCINTIQPPDDEHIILETCRRLK